MTSGSGETTSGSGEMTFGMICPGILRPVILNVKRTVSVSVNQGFYYENSAYVLFTVYLG